MKQILVLLTLSFTTVLAAAATTEIDHQSGPLRGYYERIVRVTAVPMLLNVAAISPSAPNSRFDVRCPGPGPGPNPGDHPPRPACVDAICNKGGFNCSFQSDLSQVASLCRNVDGSCVDDVCAQGGFSCSFKSDLTQVAELCRNSRGSCVRSVCAQGAFSCSLKSDLSSVIEICQNVDESCVDATCKRGGFSCTFKSDLQKVVEICRR